MDTSPLIYLIRTDREWPEEAEAARQRILAGKGTDADIALVIPYIPEFRESMRKAEHARAEGRVVSEEDARRRLDEMEKE